MKRWLPVAALIIVFLLLSCPIIANDGSTEVTGIVPLTVSGVSSSNITSSGATITWETNGDSTSQVFYGAAAGSYTSQTAITDTNPGVTQHSVTLNSLNAGTTYHYQVKSTMESDALSAASDDFSFTTEAAVSGGGGGGGGSGGGALIVSIMNLIPTSKLVLSPAGIVQNNVQLVSEDQTATLSIPTGTAFLDAQNKPLTSIYANRTVTIPASPPKGAVVLAYDFGPDGAKFNPPLTLTLDYKAAGLSPDNPEVSLFIVFWDGSQWVEIPSLVDPATHTISAKLSHFSLYVLVSKIISTPASATTPATPTALAYTPESSSASTPENTPPSGGVAVLTPEVNPAPSINSVPQPALNLSETPTPAEKPTPPISVLLMIYIFVFVVVVIATVVFVLIRVRSNW